MRRHAECGESQQPGSIGSRAHARFARTLYLVCMNSFYFHADPSLRSLVYVFDKITSRCYFHPRLKMQVPLLEGSSDKLALGRSLEGSQHWASTASEYIGSLLDITQPCSPFTHVVGFQWAATSQSEMESPAMDPSTKIPPAYKRTQLLCSSIGAWVRSDLKEKNHGSPGDSKLRWLCSSATLMLLECTLHELLALRLRFLKAWGGSCFR